MAGVGAEAVLELLESLIQIRNYNVKLSRFASSKNQSRKLLSSLCVVHGLNTIISVLNTPTTNNTSVNHSIPLPNEDSDIESEILILLV